MPMNTEDPVFALSADQVRKLTGLTDRQLRYWDKTGFFSPSYGEANRRRPFSRVYSFRDVVGLRAIAILRDRVSLQQLRAIGAWLQTHYDHPWSSLKFQIDGARINFYDPISQTWVSTNPRGQAYLPTFNMQDVADEMICAAQRLRERAADDVGKIVQSRFVLNNAPVLAGTRIPTSIVWNFVRSGHNAADILLKFPSLTLEDIESAVVYEDAIRLRKTG